MAFFKNLFREKESQEKFIDFYKVAQERQQVLDSFIDHYMDAPRLKHSAKRCHHKTSFTYTTGHLD